MTQITVVKDKKIGSLKEIKIKKYIYFVSFYIITAVLLFSGIVKILDPLPLMETLKLITIIPASLHIIFATLLPVVEIGLAVLMIMKIKPKITLATVAVLFAAFLGFNIYGTIAGIGTDCGCFGNTIKSGFG